VRLQAILRRVRNDPQLTANPYKQCIVNGLDYGNGNHQNRIRSLLETATQHHQGGRLAAAKQLYEDVLALQSDHAMALHQLGILYYQTEEYGRAQRLLQQATLYSPNTPAYYFSLGVALMATNLTEQAISCYRHALCLKPDDANVYVNMGDAYVAQQKLGEAVSCYAKAVALQPQWQEARTRLETAQNEYAKTGGPR
jgi:tetratricopeptide (TPR) repeat protein